MSLGQVEKGTSWRGQLREADPPQEWGVSPSRCTDRKKELPREAVGFAYLSYLPAGESIYPAAAVATALSAGKLLRPSIED